MLPQPIARGSSSFGLLYPMLRFLGCVFMRRQLQLIKCEEYLTNLDTREPSMNVFNVENLQCKVSQPAAVRLLFTQNFNDAKVSLFYNLLRTVSNFQFEIFVIFPL